MEAFTGVWNSLLVWPIAGALLYLTTFTASAGVAIVLFTILVRTLILPLTITQVRSQRAMMQLQPRLKELQRRHAGDRQRIAQEQMRLYREAGVNPLAGCLPMLIQMPVWIALYSALINLSSGIGSLAGAPAWIQSLAESSVQAFQGSFLWIQNLAAGSMPSGDPATWSLLILPILAAVTQWVVQKMSTMPTADPQQQQMNRMMEFMPIMFFVFSLQVGAGLALYWVVSNIYTIVQQRVFVGWGSLPILGSSELPASAVAPEQQVPTNRPNQPTRRDGQRPPRRRRRGK